MPWPACSLAQACSAASTTPYSPRFSAEQVWCDPKLDCRKSEVWNYLKMLNHVREQIEAYLTSIEFLENWEEFEKNN